MHKGTALFIVGLIAVVIVIALLIYLVVTKSGFNSGFKSNFQDLSNVDPLTKLFVKNRYARDMYATQLNVDSGVVRNAYMEFLSTANKETPTVIYDGVVETVQFMETANLYGQTVDTEKLQVYIQNLDIVLTDFFNGKYITAERIGGGDRRDQKLSNEYSELNLDGAWKEYLNTLAPHAGELGIQEDMINAINTQDGDISRYVEELERTPDIIGDVKSVKQAYDESGKRNRLEFRPYPGSSNPRVIADDSPSPLDKFGSTKDYNIPYPGILNGQTHDFPHLTQPYPGHRVAYNFNGF